MGTVTSFLSLFKPDPVEKVNVNTHINENLDKIAAGLLGQKNRLDALEGGWIGYTPEITMGVSVIPFDWTQARYRKIGDQVTVQIDGITQGNAEAITAAPQIKLPYVVAYRPVSGHGNWNLNVSGGTGTSWRTLFFAPRLNDNVLKKVMVCGWATAQTTNANSGGPPNVDNPASTKARLVASFTYITDGQIVT